MRRALLLLPLGILGAMSCGGGESAATGAGGTSTTDASSSSSGAATSGSASSGSTSSGSTSSSSSGGGGSGGAPGACGDPLTSDPDVKQALPQKYVDTTDVAPSGKTVALAAGGDLQAAIDAAMPGDVITLAPGATFTGPFTLPKKATDGYVVIRTATPDASLPSGARVGPADAAKMPKLIAPDSLPAITAAPGAHHFRFIGIEVAPVDANATIYELVAFGDGTATQAADVPHHLILDRSYIHGTTTGSTKRGVQVDCADCAVIDSYISDVHVVGQDAQAIGGFDGPGPIKIVNDYLEGSGENVLFGGADPKVPDLVPSDIEIRQNHFKKPLTWKVDDPSYAGTHWSVKNLLELKNAARVLVRCNVFENNWQDAQGGFAILLTPRNQDGTAPWCGVSDVTFAQNIVRHTSSVLNVAGEDDNNPSQETARVVVRDNLFHDVDSAKFGGAGRVYQITTPGKPVLGIKIEHNTSLVKGNAALVMGDTTIVATGLIFRNNLTTHGDYGAFGSGKGEGTAALDFFAPGYVFSNNGLVGFDAALYPPNNLFPKALADVGFVDEANGDYHLTKASTLAGAGSDGKDVGANIDALNQGTNGVAP